jgi:hypothetical protein
MRSIMKRLCVVCVLFVVGIQPVLSRCYHCSTSSPPYASSATFRSPTASTARRWRGSCAAKRILTGRTSPSAKTGNRRSARSMYPQS